MKLPNILTLARVLLTICFVFFLTKTGLLPVVIAVVLFALASLTDFYDGYYAKKHNLVTNFGKIMDPLADKFLILAALYIFVRMHIVAQWMFYVIFIREIVITASRFYAMSRGQVLGAERAGKLKTIAQMGAIFAILGYLIIQQLVGVLFDNTTVIVLWQEGIQVLMLLAVALTFISGISYLWNNRNIFQRLS
jgi:CDP-diacylglycerol---glycerol-3-phosphate 3-phosphatidyltransferase